MGSLTFILCYYILVTVAVNDWHWSVISGSEL